MTHCLSSLSSNTTEIKITLFEDFETFIRGNQQSLRKELKMFFFQGFLPTLSSLHRQSQRYMFVLSKPKDTNTTTKRLHNQALFQITWTAWNLRNVNIYWRWNCHTSYGCFIKLPYRPLASIVTGKANCAAKVRPIFIIVVIFMWPPLQSCVWSMSCLRVRYCSICAVMCWYLRMRRISVLGICNTLFFSVLLFFTTKLRFRVRA